MRRPIETTTRDTSTAHHEAAHAVVLYRTTGHPGGAVDIVRRHGNLGSAEDGVSDSFAPEDMEGRILSCYAGGHAQRVLDPGTGADGCEKDEAIATGLLAEFGWEPREPDLRARSLALTRQHWAEIVAVATELLRVRVLEDTEVEIIADAAAGDPVFPDLAQYRALRGDTLESWRATYMNEEEEHP